MYSGLGLVLQAPSNKIKSHQSQHIRGTLVAHKISYRRQSQKSEKVKGTGSQKSMLKTLQRCIRKAICRTLNNNFTMDIA